MDFAIVLDRISSFNVLSTFMILASFRFDFNCIRLLLVIIYFTSHVRILKRKKTADKTMIKLFFSLFFS